ncbi:YpbB family protein [Pseudoneobacillus sp. C159]
MEKYLHLIILFCLDKLNGERTIYSVYHLLKGKKSSQTIQDAHLFKLAILFQTYANLTRTNFDHIINDLHQDNLINNIEGEKFKLTSNGVAYLNKNISQHPIPKHLNGWKHHSEQVDFWKRLSLFIQVCSNLINYESSFIPIYNDIESSTWVKKTLINLKRNREDLVDCLIQELLHCLKGGDDLFPEILITRLTGFKHIGLTSAQASEELRMDHNYYQLLFLNHLHFMIENISDNITDYPILQSLLPNNQTSKAITKSSFHTYQYLQKGYSVEEISAIRNLKSSTIEDHIVEIAILDTEFPLDSFIDKHTEKIIVRTIKELRSKQLKLIRNHLNEQVSYFQIRLVLARLGDVI